LEGEEHEAPPLPASLAIPLVLALAAGCKILDQISNIVGNTKVSVKLENGETIEGTLLKQGDGQSVVKVSYGTVTVTASDTLTIESRGPDDAPTPGSGRLAKWDRCLEVAAGRPWAAQLRQIPATVVDVGVLKNVPYMSHRSGGYEVNIYGDPDLPACLEIGIYNLNPAASARRECIDAMVQLLNDAGDREFVQRLSLEAAKAERTGLVFEVTPPSAEDAYNGWWISVYDLKALERQRASDAELAQITVPRAQVKPGGGVLRWNPADLRMARPDEGKRAEESRVYVRGIHRKNGVYVKAFPD
jgi:hypothetical protein